MSRAAVADLLGRRIGLDPESLGATVLPAAVAEHMRALGVADEGAYAACLAQSPARLQELTERLVVRETWFFRNGELFSFLPSVLAAALRQAPPRPLRILSLPCSTGEEPYSLALILLETCVPVERWRIDAIDLSEVLLDIARRGVYRAFSFRQTPAELRSRYFRERGGEWELDAAVRRLVAFRAGNILDPALGAGAPPYDLILCRNLLIYFTPAARLQAVANLERLLAPDGLLALGHAEPQMLAGRGFELIGPDACFLFRRKPAEAARNPSAKPRDERSESRGSAPVRASASPLHSASPRGTAPPAPRQPEPDVAPPLDQARRLADGNRLDEALAACLAQLARAGPSADAFSLLGVVHQARGNAPEAAEAFRKALYLDPDHGEALTHSMLLSAQRGDVAHAAALRERLARLTPGGKP